MRFLLAAVFLFFATSLPAAGSDNVRTHTELIRSSDHTFEIDVRGTIDPENLEITVENAGDVAVKELVFAGLVGLAIGASCGSAAVYTRTRLPRRLDRDRRQRWKAYESLTNSCLAEGTSLDASLSSRSSP